MSLSLLVRTFKPELICFFQYSNYQVIGNHAVSIGEVSPNFKNIFLQMASMAYIDIPTKKVYIIFLPYAFPSISTLGEVIPCPKIAQNAN